MEKIAVITYDMIPYASSWGSCQRMYYLSEFLLDKGYSIEMFSSSKNRYGNFGKKINFGINYFPPEKESVEISETKSVNEKAGKIKTVLKKAGKKFDKFYFNDPFPGMGLLGYFWLRNFKKDIVKKVLESGAKKVIISSPPFSILKIANDIKKADSTIKVIFDFRDPWNTWNDNKGIPHLREKKILKAADKIVVVTESVKREKMRKYGIAGEKIEVVYNGYSSPEWKRAEAAAGVPEENKIMTLSYLGNIDFKKGGFRDTTEFFAAYDMLGEDKKKIKLRFIGVGNNEETEKLKNRYSEVEFVGKISSEEAMVEMLKSDVLLNIHTLNDKSSQLMIPGKIFDYIKSGKEILSISDESSIATQMINENRFGEAVINERNLINEKFKILIDKFEKKELNKKDKNSIENLEKYSREYQYKRYLEILDKI